MADSVKGFEMSVGVSARTASQTLSAFRASAGAAHSVVEEGGGGGCTQPAINASRVEAAKNGKASIFMIFDPIFLDKCPLQ